MIKTVYAILIAVIALTVFSCKKDKFNTSSSFQLEFSRDTVLFDTVFTTIGSATQVFKVYNPDKTSSVEIDYFALENSTDSKFRINVDGESGTVVENVIIAPEDSVFVFVEVNLDVNGTELLPFIVEENLLVNANGSDQNVKLAVWGQDAHFHVGSPIRISQEGEVEFDGYLECDEVWNNDLPHVIYGGAVGVGENCCLTINPGTQVHVHNRSGILVDRGCIESNGQLGNEVVFQGDRLEFEYDDVPGQWGIELDFIADLGIGPEVFTFSRGGIWLLEAKASFMDYTVIKNGVVGLQVDTTGAGSDDALQLRNCIIRNHSAIGVLAQGATMSGFNNLFANCGQSTAQFQYGGQYIFDHCTFANYWSQGTRQAPSFLLTNNYDATVDGVEVNIVRSLNNTAFRNCAFYGDNASLSDYSEFIVLISDPESESFRFENCLVDAEDDISDPAKYINMINQQNASFMDPSIYDFRPTANSPLRDAASVIGGELSTDLVGVFRFDGDDGPDIGCLEYTP